MDKVISLNQFNLPLTQTLPSNKPNSSPFRLLDVSEPYKPKPVSAITRLESLSMLKQMHTQMIKMEKKSVSAYFTYDDVAVSISDTMVEDVIKMYLKLNDLRSGTTLFLLEYAKRYAPMTSLLDEFKKVEGREVFEVFAELHCKGLISDSANFTAVLRLFANTSLVDVRFGMKTHACLIKKGFESDTVLICALMNFYGNKGSLEYADQVFAETSNKSVKIWNEVVMVHLRNESFVEALELFRGMRFSNMRPNVYMIVKMLQVCGDLEAIDVGKQIHAYVITSGLVAGLAICNSLISMYTKCSTLEPAYGVFRLMDEHNLVSWNTMISGYSLNGKLDEAWKLYKEMELSEMKPDSVTWNCLMSGHFLKGSYKKVLMILREMISSGLKPSSRSMTSALRAIIEQGYLDLGKEVHGFLVRNDLGSDIYVNNLLVDMYVKNFRLDKARTVFDLLENKNFVTYNTMISGYAYNGHFAEALKLLNQMEEEGIKPDLVTWNSLISGYSMHGRRTAALLLIRKMKSSGLIPNVVSWTAIISGCCQNENYNEALDSCLQMQQEGVKPNSATISTLLTGCAGLSLLQKGREIHCVAIRSINEKNIFVATSLIDMYSKSGSLENAYRVFLQVQNKNLPLWNAMIMGFSIHGKGKEAISLFNEMGNSGVIPDTITFTAVLSACRYSGLVDEGWKYFDDMTAHYRITPELEHYSCMVDLLGKGGYLDEALDIIQTMPLEPDISIWGSLLASCRMHNNLDLAEDAAKRLFRMEPYNSANYIMLKSLYANANRWDDVEKLKDFMYTVGVKSRQGWSWIQIHHAIHVFSVKGDPHPDTGEIFFELYQLISEMKKLGYVPDLSCVHEDIDSTEKVKVLMNHTEKLAVTYGLMKSWKSGPIRVVKNTRVCADCHAAVKYMSLIRRCKICIKDVVRFHHFENGKCSCDDYW